MIQKNDENTIKINGFLSYQVHQRAKDIIESDFE